MYAPPVYGSVPTVDPQAQASMLRTQAENLKAQLSSIEREIEKLGSSEED
jgi:prefoldin subunit 5